MGKMNVVAVLNQLQEEKVSSLVTHPYYGLKDSRGWLTRYPAEGLEWTRQEVRDYVSEGGNFDSEGVWGCSPYNRYPLSQRETGYSMPASVLGRLVKSYKRFDYLPQYEGEFPVHETLDLTSYFRLTEGAKRKYILSQFGVEYNGSLFTLAKKPVQWLWKKAQKECTEKVYEWVNKYSYMAEDEVEEEFSLLLNFFLPEEDDSPVFSKLRKDFAKYFRRHNLRYDIGKKVVPVSNPDRWIKRYLSNKSTGFDIAGVRYFIPYCYVNTTVEHLAVMGSYVLDGYRRNVIGRVKTVGSYKTFQVRNTTFVWEAHKSFDTHIECTSLREGLEILLGKKAESHAKDKFFSEGIISLRTFKNHTGSCLAGTKSFLREKAPHIYRLIQEFDSWDMVISNEIADIEWYLTDEFKKLIEFRFN